MNTGTPLLSGPAKPGKVQAIAIMTLVSGIVNLFWGLAAVGGLLWTVFCWPFGAFPLVLGVLEIVYATKLLSSGQMPVQPAKTVAIMEICNILYGNVFSLIVGIIALVLYDDPEVKSFYEALPSSPQTIS